VRGEEDIGIIGRFSQGRHGIFGLGVDGTGESLTFRGKPEK